MFAINQIIKDVFTTPRTSPRAAYIAPLYRQAKTVAWDYLKHFSRVIPNVTFNEAELRIDYPGDRRVQLFGADNPDSLRGMYLDSVVLDEYAQMAPKAWSEVIRPALSDCEGRAIFIGTPMGHNQFYDRYQAAEDLPGWFRAIYRASETGILPEGELEMAKREMTSAEYEQEYECSWSAAIKGAYWAEQIQAAENEGRITSVPYDENFPVVTSWDLGVKDSTVVWFAQELGSETRFINCLAYKGSGLPDIIRDLDKLPYYYSQHKAPHDIQVRELGTGKSRLEIAQQLGIDFTIAPKLSVQDGISAVRSHLKRCVFDKQNCSDGLEALRQYRTEYDDKRQVFSLRPLHDWTSDYADSMRYYCITPTADSWSGDLDYSMANQL